jgi:transcriptional regulator with XRE-family HTH domain
LHESIQLSTVVYVTEVGELGEVLRVARTARGMSLKAVAEDARISPAYVHKLEAGRVRSPSPRVLLRVAQALGLEYGTLMRTAGYAPTGIPSAQPRKEQTMAKASAREFTNQEIVRLLGAVLASLRELSRRQEQLAREVQTLARARRA